MKMDFKKLIENSQSEFITRRTVIGLVRSILTPLADSNSKSMVFYRFKDREEISGLIKRLEYSVNVEMYDFSEREILKLDDFVELEFLLITSARFNAFLLWDYSSTKEKDKTQFYLLMNSKQINDCFEFLQAHSKVDFRETFYQYRPERRDNELLNDALGKIVCILNDNISENEFKNKEEIETAKKFESFSEIRSYCHEIKNQLSILDIYSEILKREHGESKYIEMIKKSISLISLQLKEIKGLSDGSICACEDIASIIEKAIQMIQEFAIPSGNKIVFTNNALQDTTTVDSNKFLTIIINILKNAVESTKNDEISVTLNIEDGYTKVRVRNHGEKIEPEAQAKIFDEGFSTKENGWGVGLATSRRYIRNQGGEIELTNSDDDYTEFLIKIPLARGLDEITM